LPNVKDEPRALAGEPFSSNEKARSSEGRPFEIAAPLSALALATGSALSSFLQERPHRQNNPDHTQQCAADSDIHTGDEAKIKIGFSSDGRVKTSHRKTGPTSNQRPFSPLFVSGD
jgi:hypothetical protein